VALIMVAASGQNSIVVVPGANGRYLPDDLSRDIANLEPGGVALLQLEIPMPTVLSAARRARENGRLVILDPAPVPAAPLPAELFGLIDILTPNETEAAALADVPTGRLTTEEAAVAARKLRARGGSTVIVKLGEQGCLLVEKTRIVAIEAPHVQAVDTTAAGDVFNAALAVGLSERQSVEEACRFAVQAAALSVTRLGAQASAPDREEVAQFAASVASAGAR
jgi:ribokinase